MKFLLQTIGAYGVTMVIFDLLLVIYLLRVGAL